MNMGRTALCMYRIRNPYLTIRVTILPPITRQDSCQDKKDSEKPVHMDVISFMC